MVDQVAKKGKGAQGTQMTTGAAAAPASDTQIAQMRFELENEILEEELYKFDEAEVDKLF